MEQDCVSLSSPKSKQEKMKNGVDFHKILDSDGKLIGVLDFNNMIPVHKNILREVDLKIHPHDSREIRSYKNLMIDQLNFCRQSQDILVKKAFFDGRIERRMPIKAQQELAVLRDLKKSITWLIRQPFVPEPIRKLLTRALDGEELYQTMGRAQPEIKRKMQHQEAR